MAMNRPVMRRSCGCRKTAGDEMVRRWTCRHYGECLDKAARTDARRLSCDGCERYALPDPVLAAEPLPDVVVKTNAEEGAASLPGGVVMEKEKVQGGVHLAVRSVELIQLRLPLMGEYFLAETADPMRSEKAEESQAHQP